MPAVTTTTSPRSQASVVDLLFSQNADQRGPRRDVTRPEHDPLSPAEIDTSPFEDAIAGELGLSRDSHAFQRQSRLEAGRSQFAEARSSFNQALQDAQAEQAPRAQAELKPDVAAKPASESVSKLDSKSSSNSESPNTAKPAAEPKHKPTQSPQQAQTNDQAKQPASTRTPEISVQALTQRAANPQISHTATQQTASAAISATSASAAAAPTTAQSAQPMTNAQRATSELTTPQAPKAAKSSAKPANDPAPFERILRFARLQSNKDHASATMRLDQPELGKIRVEMDVRDDTLRMKIDSQNNLAHRMLTENSDALRRALESAGVRVAELEIRTAAHSESPEGTRDSEADGSASEDRLEQESLSDSDRQSTDGDTDSGHDQGEMHSAEVAEATQMRVGQDTLIDLQA